MKVLEVNVRIQYLSVFGLITILIAAACAAKATPPAVNDMATNIALGVSAAQTKTAEAPTPIPSATPTNTPIPATMTSVPQQPVVLHFAPCWFGPGNAYHLESNIEKGERVQLVGVGSIPGWYIIINPYFQQRCWIQAVDLSIDPNMDLSQYPMMTPIPLITPKP